MRQQLICLVAASVLGIALNGHVARAWLKDSDLGISIVGNIERVSAVREGIQRLRQRRRDETNSVGGLILVWLGSGAVGLAKNGKRAPTGDAEFKALIDKYYVAWSSMNTDNAAPLYAKDGDLVFYDIAPLKYNGWHEYAPGVKKNFFDNSTSARLTPNDDLKVTRHGNIAWTSVTFHLSAKLKNGQNLDVEGRHTAVWEKRGGKWLIVHEHVSAPLPG